MRHIILLFLTAFITFASISEGNSQNRYWVNGTGSWDEINHWSETSGGKPGASVPTENDNVIFDDNSFLNSSEFVQIKKQASCKDFRWEVEKSGNTLKSSSFLLKSLTSAEINIHGSAIINNNLRNEYYGDIVFKGNNKSSVNINSDLNSNLIFNSENGNWQFDSELKTSGDIKLVSGKVDLNDLNVECNTFQGSGTENRSVNLGNSIITANKWDFENTENLAYTGNNFLISLKTDNLKTNLFSGDLPINVEKAGAKAAFVVYPFDITDVTCYGGSDGEFTMSVEGGTKPYTYTLRNNTTLVTLTETTNDTIWTFTGLTAHEHYAEVRHFGGGVFGDNYDVDQPEELKALAPTVTKPLSCYDGSDAEITANPSGGTAPYTFQWYERVGAAWVIIPGPRGTDQTLINVGQGIYQYVLNDANDCGLPIGDVSVIYYFTKPPLGDAEIPPQISFDSYSFTEECDGASDGTIDISASGGTGDMDYYLYGQTVGDTVPLVPPPYDEDGSFTGLPAQTYETYAIDANGCRLRGNDITITDYPAPTVDAGSSEETCEEISFDLGTATILASANNESSLLWDDAGAPGTFDNATILDPTYTPAVGQTGPVTLTLTAFGNGSCASVNDFMTLTIKANSIAPTSATVDNNNFCPGAFANITLSYVGGTLGAGATAEWYSDAAFTIPVGSGQDLTIAAPATTTTYYVRFEGDCNNTTGASIQVIIKTESTDPTGINSSNANFCPGNSTDLTVLGGSLGTAATWEWYSGSCGGTAEGTGAGITVSPAVTTTYYVRAEGDCNTTVCANFTVTVKTASVAPTSATANRNNYCPGVFPNVRLTYVGGTLGDGATAEWYSDAGFTTNVGSGQNLIITPAPVVTTTYYVRFEGDCNTTTAASVTVNVKTESTDPIGINTDNDNFCPGESANLTVQGGSLGTGATWEWYTGSCGGTFVGSGPILNVSPVVTTTYYVLADGDCNTTACASITLTVNTESTVPTGINTDNDNFCPGGTANLTVQGGSLGLGATWEWYSGTCGGISEGTGAGISVSPTVTTTYFVRAEGTCNTTACVSLIITVKTESVAPTLATVDNNNFCPGDFANITLSYVGGPLGTGATAEWYSDALFTIPVGSGQDLTIAAPATTTTYYVRFEGDCNNTIGASIEVVIFTESTDPTGINSSNTNFCPGSSTDLTVQGGSLGTGATWEWYSGSCGGTYVGTGASINVSPIVSTDYYVRAEGTCNNTACANITITVKTESVSPTSATVDNSDFCPGDFANITLSYVGGTLGDGATAEWYSDATFTTNVGSGQDLTIAAPVTTTTYYVRFEGDCNNTIAASVTVIIKTQSTAPTGASVDNTDFCDGIFTDITLSYIGGTLGTGATAEWYSDAGFITNVGSGQDVTIPAPAVTTTYYVRFEGDCNNTVAASVLVTIFQNPVVDILPPEPVVTCTNVDLSLDGNTTGGALPFASEVWTGADLTPLSDPNIEEPTFNTSTSGSYSFTYTVIDANGCTDNDNVTITVNQSAYAYAGADTLLCYGSDFTVPDADTLNCSGITWTTDGGDGDYFGTQTLINPTYTPGPGDMINGYVKLVISAAGYAPCGSTTDTVLVTYLPELVLSVGKPTPFYIDATTIGSRTHIDVYTKITGHWFLRALGIYLVAPDNSAVELKPVCPDPFYINFYESETYKFYNDAEDTSAVVAINECEPISGRYKFSGDWKTDLDGQDPTNGAWRIRIEDSGPFGNTGILNEATIAFSDTNDVTKFFETVLYADSSINLPINGYGGSGPNAVTEYALPITGFSTSCFGFCDATAIASATGGQGEYSYEWSTSIDFNPADIFEFNDTVDLCAGTYYVRVTDEHLCSDIDSVVVSEPSEIVITNSDVTDVSCNGDTNGEIMLEFAGGSGNLKYTLDSIVWYNSGETIINLVANTYRVAIRDMLLGCEKDTIVTIDEPDPIDPNFDITPITCFGYTDGEITSTPTNGASPYDFAWSTGFTELGVISSTISGLNSGTYTVTITDANLCELIADTIVATAPDALDIISVDVRDKRCIACDSRDPANSLGRIIVNIDGGTEPFSYNWTGPASFTPIDTNMITNLQAGVYNVTVTDGSGCQKDSLNNIVNMDSSFDILAFDVEFADESVCWNDSVEIISTYTGDADTLYLLIFNEDIKTITKRYKPTLGLNPYTALIDIDATSTFQIIRIMNDYCKADFADNVTVEYFPDFNLDIIDGIDGNATDDTIYLKGSTSGELSAYVSDNSGISFTWTPDESLSIPTAQTTVVSPDSSGWYQVVAISDDDCIDTSRIYLEFIPAITPNDGFSPNDDGINDYWRIKFIEKFKNNIVTIYNRWGIKVYEQKGYDNNDPSKVWNGKAKNGKDLASGTYYYIIVLNEEGYKPITGPVTIIR